MTKGLSDDARVSRAAMRRLTLTRMLIWAATEAEEIGCTASAHHLAAALRAIADQIGRRSPPRSDQRQDDLADMA